MRKTMHKWFWAWSFDKEEKWLNQMAAKGLALVAVSYCTYTFEDCTPGAYNVRLELLENVPTHAESQQYIKFLEDTGAEYLGAVMRWIYIRKKTTDGEFNLFSDSSSRIQHINRILTVIGIAGALNIYIGVTSLVAFFENQAAGSVGYAMFSFSVGLFITCGFFKMFLMKRKLQKQQNLFE